MLDRSGCVSPGQVQHGLQDVGAIFGAGFTEQCVVSLSVVDKTSFKASVFGKLCCHQAVSLSGITIIDDLCFSLPWPVSLHRMSEHSWLCLVSDHTCCPRAWWEYLLGTRPARYIRSKESNMENNILHNSTKQYHTAQSSHRTLNTYTSAACKGEKNGSRLLIGCSGLSDGTNWNVLLGVCEPRYLDHVHPLPNVEEAALAGDVVQQQHAVRTAEIRLGNAAEPDEKQTMWFYARICRLSISFQLSERFRLVRVSRFNAGHFAPLKALKTHKSIENRLKVR